MFTIKISKVEYLGVHLWSFELNVKGVMTSPNLFNNYGMINYVLGHNNDIDEQIAIGEQVCENRQRVWHKSFINEHWYTYKPIHLIFSTPYEMCYIYALCLSFMNDLSYSNLIKWVKINVIDCHKSR
jgi:hypothetical protein